MPPALRQRLLTEGRPGALAFVATQTDVLVRWLVLQMVYYAVFMLRVFMLCICVCIHSMYLFLSGKQMSRYSQIAGAFGACSRSGLNTISHSKP